MKNDKPRPRRPRKPRASKAQVLLRLTEVLRIRLEGAKLWDVSEYVAEKEAEDGSPWKLGDGETPLSRRQIERYIERADKVIAASTEESSKRALVKHLARREDLYAKAVNAGDIRTALAVAQDEAKLRSLYPAAKHEVTGKGGTPIVLNIVEEVVGPTAGGAPAPGLPDIAEEIVTPAAPLPSTATPTEARRPAA